MFSHVYDCIGKAHLSQKEDKFLFVYAFQVEPQSGDLIELMDDELKDTEIAYTRWRIVCRKFVRGNVLIVVYPLEGVDGLVQA